MQLEWQEASPSWAQKQVFHYDPQTFSQEKLDMATTFKLKAQTVTAIDVQAPIAQASDIAAFIGASAFIVDIMANTVTLTMPVSGHTIPVTAGKVISIIAGEIKVQDSSEFYSMYEPEGIR